MNHSIYTADRTTHLKVVVAALMAGIAIVMTALTVQLNRPGIDVQKSTNLAVQLAHPVHVKIQVAQR
ncbi:hypothetical protein I6F30_01870 [Bradyrhizobium sp. NBAIM20]|uniref:hypothetical protein n=1 Tax=unclassified Bradyrhizobium TaxID=2631580 RepID=UPI001CD677FB|nr:MULTISPECIES: hypothetical protein [unclassified Bradyrhizobium]MCA1409912.1 hypothetical protein [Bradyrhizobium sp. NBAIM20]MCA1459801.1 hypothetical protein [Bradyrhizobium sp. NBAIM18]